MKMRKTILISEKNDCRTYNAKIKILTDKQISWAILKWETPTLWKTFKKMEKQNTNWKKMLQNANLLKYLHQIMFKDF